VEDESETAKAFKKRFFAGVPNIPNKDKDKMEIYLLFLQHIISSLSPKGKAAVVVPTGFLTAGKGKATNIANKIRMQLVDKGWLRAVVSMPSNIFANTGTNVSVLFIDKGNTKGKVVLLDASGLGTQINNGKNKKTLLSPDEEQRIIDAVNGQMVEDLFCVVKTFAEIKDGRYSFNPGSYFDVKIAHVEITPDEFAERMRESQSKLANMFIENKDVEQTILEGFGVLGL